MKAFKIIKVQKSYYGQPKTTDQSIPGLTITLNLAMEVCSIKKNLIKQLLGTVQMQKKIENVRKIDITRANIIY